MVRCQKVPKFNFQSQFSKSKIIGIFLILYSWKNINLGAHFLLLTFFDKINFKITYITKMMPYFWQLTINPKFNHFLKVWWFLGKNLPNFVSPIWKLHNPYCHNEYYFSKKGTKSFTLRVRIILKTLNTGIFTAMYISDILKGQFLVKNLIRPDC